MSGRVALIDGTGFAYRAFHALPESMATTAGLPTNAVYGFATMFRKVFAGRALSHATVVFDAKGPTFRHRADPAYKAHRPPMPASLQDQLPLIEQLVEAHGVPQLKVQDVEADDVIGTLARLAEAAGHEVWIVSPDKDFAQLIGPKIRQLDTRTDTLLDADRVRRRYGVPPERFVDWLALVGDRADGIPGVPGIGPTTAAECLTVPLEQLLLQPPEGRIGDLLRTHAEQARASAALATIRTDVPLPKQLDDLAIDGPDLSTLNAIYHRFEFYSLLSAESLATHGDGPVQYFVCDSLEMVAGALEHETTGPDPVAVHVLTELDGPQRGALLGFALSPRRGRGVYVPIHGPDGLGPQALTIARPWLEGPLPKVFHGAKDALRIFADHDVTLGGIAADTALGSYLLDPTRHIPHRLDQVTRDILHVALQPLKGLIGSGKRRIGFLDLTIDRAGAWACHNADATGAVWTQMAPMLDRDGRTDELVAIDLPLCRVLARMESVGIGADPDAWMILERQFSEERRDVALAAYAAAGRRFSLGSGKQLGTVLFDELKLPVQGRTKTGYRTDASVLKRLQEAHPLVPLVQRWKTLDTLIQTYTKVLRTAVAFDGRIHPTYQATSSASGRILTTDPDLQRTPIHTEESRAIRDALTAGPGRYIVRADWSQLELRLLAHLSADAGLIEAYRTSQDVHRQTAAAVLECAESEVDGPMRELGKTINFATIYGQGPSALAEQLDVSPAQARRFIDAFFVRYAGVAAWRDRTIVNAHRDGYVSTLMGRRRYLPELTHRNRADRSHSERVALNAPIQGSGADLCKRALLRASATLPEGAELVLQIHDELLVECDTEQVDDVSRVLREAMEGVAKLAVPLRVSVGVGRSWREAHDS